MKHKTLLLAVEPLQQGKTPGRLGTTVKSTPLRKKTEPRKLRNYESSRQSLTRIMSAFFCSSRSRAGPALPARRKCPQTGSRGTPADRRRCGA